ncbi:MAG TPA: hypothetical protein VH253_14285 [Phycisphaerae bacterium]|nr:hypothetical protein [Phycisphaerae bacterium]
MPQWEPSEPYVEQYFPQQMSWYAAEGPQGLHEDLLRKVREHPWKAMAISLLLGFGCAMFIGPAARWGAGLAGRSSRRPGNGDCQSAGAGDGRGGGR